MKLLFTIFLSFLFVGVMYSQDTISTYFDEDGKLCDLGMARYFKSDKTGYTYRYFSEGHLSKKEKPAYDPMVSSKNGVFVFKDSSDIIRERVTYLDDAYHGEILTYYNSGEIRDQENFDHNKRQGKCSYFYENGQLSSEEVYNKDSLIEFKLYHPDGSVDETASTPTEFAGFPGGSQGLSRYLSESIRYPSSAIKDGVSGRVYLRFIVNENGKVEGVKVQRGIANCPDCAIESIRVVETMPDWSPARDHNRYVKSYYSLPIKFELQSSRKRKR